MPFKFGLRKENRVGLNNGQTKKNTNRHLAFAQTKSNVGRFHENKMRGNNNDPDLNFNATANVRPLNVNAPNFFEKIRPRGVRPTVTRKMLGPKAKTSNRRMSATNKGNGWNWNNTNWENITPKANKRTNKNKPKAD